MCPVTHASHVFNENKLHERYKQMIIFHMKQSLQKSDNYEQSYEILKLR